MSNFKIFGQTPAAISAAFEAVLAILLSFGVFGLTNEMAGGIVAVVTAALALVVAYATKRTVLAAVSGLVKAGIMAAATFGWALNDAQQAAVLSAVALVGGLFIHETNSSLDTAVSNASPGTRLTARNEAGESALYVALVVLVVLAIVFLLFRLA